MAAFSEMGVMPEIAQAVEEMDWLLPTDIQAESIPLILGGGDVLMAAETGSGKTGGLRYKVQSMEAKVEDLEKENSALTARLTASETTVDELKARTTALHTRLSASETELTRETTERPKVAFSASLPSGKRGRFTTETKLVYSRVFTNRSKAYNSVTGVFTAPVRGVYDFRFTAYDNPNPDGYSIDVYMYKNGMRITTISTYGTTASTAVSLELEVGDTVYLRLPANGRLNDYADNRNIFSGFLLFPL